MLISILLETWGGLYQPKLVKIFTSSDGRGYPIGPQCQETRRDSHRGMTGRRACPFTLLGYPWCLAVGEFVRPPGARSRPSLVGRGRVSSGTSWIRRRKQPPPRGANGAEGRASKEPVTSVRDGAMRSFMGLFIVPLLVVLVCVGVFVGFGWIAYDRQTTDDYLNDLKSSWRPQGERRLPTSSRRSSLQIRNPSNRIPSRKLRSADSSRSLTTRR